MTFFKTRLLKTALFGTIWEKLLKSVRKQKPLIQTSDNHVYENRDINYFPCLISAVLMQHIEYSKGSDKLGKIENIIFENIYVTSKHIQSICIKGEDNTHVVSNLLIRNIFLNKKAFKRRFQY